MPKVSVIIPVYKAEKYLEKCVNSVLQQTFMDFECILVDDRSPDMCGIMCDKLAMEDSRINVIHNKTNLGASMARKTGLSAASGDYVFFVDSDDHLEPSMIEKLFNVAIANAADMVYCDYYETREIKNGDKTENTIKIIGETDSFSAIKQIIANASPMHMTFWNKLIKREIYERAHFPDDTAYYEDNYIILQTFYYSKIIVYLNEALYYYNVANNNSMMRGSTRKLIMLESKLRVFQYIESFLAQFYGDDLALFEPNFSFAVNKLKHRLLKYGFTDLSALSKFHPRSAQYIFGNVKMTLRGKLYLWLALRLGIKFQYRLWNDRLRK
ncbi:MAG: glycosyltransferase [Helicobacteraceae bacterium]|jgi:glycosyltransferase involved in cell wall biosynthesis|nr:glycosyltransferase [Helicobacteraceae bacterium]